MVTPTLLLTGIVVAIGIVDAVSTHRFSFRRRGVKAKDQCDSQIYCQGDLLKTVQLSGIFKDSKTFVDMSQSNEPAITLANFQKMMQATNNTPTRDEVKQFVQENFLTEDELLPFNLTDWQENPTMLKRIEDPAFREWAKDLNAIWKKLARKIKDTVRLQPDKHSLIYVNDGFIVPGGRFKEFYYWDSYWVIKGLLLSDMVQTARGMINNFLSMVDRYGFVPNGGRVYYLMRSQPPLLIPMVADYIEFTNDKSYLESVINTLDREFAFWHPGRTTKLYKNGRNYALARYIVESNGPRPESYREDYRLAERFPSEERKKVFYEDIKAAAESGWDFSYRWVISDNNTTSNGLSDVHTRDIIPVDLNAHLQRNARILSEFHESLGNMLKAKRYKAIADSYQEAIDAFLWDEQDGTWYDYDIKNNQSRRSFYPTNLTPLYTMSYTRNSRDVALDAVAYLKEQGIDLFFGGTPASLSNTNEQWDFPNAWPPLQSFIVMGLYQTGVQEAIQMSEMLAARWLRANYLGYEESGKMFEKYNAEVPGQGGGGGEYTNQEGFGWTNGVILEFLYTYPSTKNNEGTSSYAVHSNKSINAVER